MAAPIEIRLLAPKPAVIVGEEPVLQIAHRVFAELDMETVALNRARTVIHIQTADGGASWALTGQDHIAFHSVHPLTEVGSRFRAPAGAEWSEPLHLLNYGAALGAGRYLVSLSYRYGETEAESVTAAPVAVEVLPARHLSNGYRWLGGKNAHGELANLWRAESDGAARWIYQIAGRKNPGAVYSAVDVRIPADAAPFAPVLAHINDIAQFHFERYAVWAEPEALGCVPVNQEGRNREPRRYRHELSAARVVEPPLQFGNGALAVVLVGANRSGAACLTMAQVDETGQCVQTEIPLAGGVPDFVMAAWPDGKPPESGVVYWGRRGESALYATPLRLPARSAPIALPGGLAGLAIEQWLGVGNITALIQDATELRTVSVPILSSPAVTVGATLGAAEFVDFAVAPGGANAYLLVRRPESWQVGEASVSVDNSVDHPHLVTTPTGGPWLVGFDSKRGFVVERLAPPEPPPLL